MNNKSWIRKYRYLGIFFFFLLIVSIALGLSKYYPLTNSRDWLNILSDFGQAFGMLAIVSLILELIYREAEVTEKRKPRIQIESIVMVDKLPNGKPNCLCENNQGELPPKELISKDDDYRELYIAIGRPDPHTDRYFRIEIKNNQSHYEGSTRNLKLYIRLNYGMEDETQKVETYNFWASRKGLSLQAGESEYLFVRCGKIQDPIYTKISGEILDFKCTNLLGDPFTKKDVPDFEEKEIPQQLLYRVLANEE